MMRTLLILALASGFAVAACGPGGSDPAPSEPSAATAAPVAAPPSTAPSEETVMAEPAGLGIAFDHAAGLRVRPCDGDTPRCVVLSDPAADPFMRELVTIQVHDGALEAVAASEAGFERTTDGRLMTTYGRFEPVAVEAFEVNGRPSLRAVITCGVSDPETGFHAAGGACLWGVVGDGKRSVVIASSGFENGLDAARAAVASLRFLPPR